MLASMKECALAGRVKMASIALEKKHIFVFSNIERVIFFAPFIEDPKGEFDFSLHVCVRACVCVVCV